MHSYALAGLVTSLALLVSSPAIATTVTITDADNWGARRGAIADASGKLTFTFKNNTGVDLKDLHVLADGKQYKLVPGFAGSIAPFTMHSFTRQNGLMNMWGGSLANGDMFSVGIGFTFNGGSAANRVVAFRVKGTTDGNDTTAAPLPASLSAILAGLACLAMLGRRGKRTV